MHRYGHEYNPGSAYKKWRSGIPTTAVVLMTAGDGLTLEGLKPTHLFLWQMKIHLYMECTHGATTGQFLQLNREIA